VSPFERDQKLERDIVTTKAWVTMEDNRIGLCVMKGDLPRNAKGWGEIGKGWRVTLPTGEQGIVTDFGEQWGGVVVDLDVGMSLPLMRARLRRRRLKTAPLVVVRIERLDENTIVMPSKVVAS
jgi:hypothetical protein